MDEIEKEQKIKEALLSEDRFYLNSKIDILDECIDDGFENIIEAREYYKKELKRLENK